MFIIILTQTNHVLCELSQEKYVESCVHTCSVALIMSDSLQPYGL